MSAPLGVIAGRGDLPVRVVEAAQARGQDVFVVCLKGFEEPRLERIAGATVGLGEIGHLIKALKSAGCEALVFAGNVARPDFGALKLDWRGARLLPRVLKAARQGDDALLQVMLQVFQEEGFTILGADDVAGDLLAPTGLIAGPAPNERDMEDIARALVIAREIGRMDIGQGCVVCDGLVLAVEAQEGTDAMLARCAALPAELRGRPDAPRGVLVKVPKPIQDRKIDLPTIGMQTLRGLQRAGLAGVAVEAGGALIMDRPELDTRASADGLFVYGLETPG